MTGVVSVTPGAIVTLPGHGEYIVRGFITATKVQLESVSTAEIRPALLTDLDSSAPRSEANAMDLAEADEPGWAEAKRKYGYVQELLSAGGGAEAALRIATKAGAGVSTLYKWKADYQKGQLMTNLYRKKRSDAGRVRLPRKVEAIMRMVIKRVYYKEERPRAGIAYKAVELRCKKRGLKIPSLDTFKARIAVCEGLESATLRGEVNKAKSRRLSGESITGADFPNALVQIDHTRVDIQLVDEEHRISIGRPWITVAIDVYSRMCVGYYISFDPPGSLGTGLCLSHAFLDKTKWMQELGVMYDYPCMGVPGILHADNAKEFKGNTLKHACEEYGASLQFREGRVPEQGAHIERLMGTLMHRIHALEGTTFSNSVQKGEYDSEEKASMTLKEFDLWFAHLVLGEYHHQTHAGIGDIAPIVRYKQGIVGGPGLPVGQIDVVTDEERLYYDFLPLIKQTVQSYGIQIDKIHYSGEVLSRWVGAMDSEQPTKRRVFIMRRDPRDISAVFFLDPDTRRYFRIPYRNLANPHISIWELRRVRAYLKALGQSEVDEELIFKTYATMTEIEARASAKTKHVRHTNSQKLKRRRQESPQPKFGRAAEDNPQEIAPPDGDFTVTPTDKKAIPGPESTPVGFDDVETF